MSEQKKKLHFACGGIYEINNEPLLNRNGRPQRMLVFANGREIKMPKPPEGKSIHCLLNCPARVKDSGRKVQMAWVGDDAREATGKPVRCVLCQPTHVS